MNYEKELEKAKLHAEKVKIRQELYDIRHANDRQKEKLPTGKKALKFMIINCSIIELYSLFAMYMLQDLSPLTTLIAAVVGECVSIISYNIKSSKENTSGGIVYESAMKKLKYELEESGSDEYDDGAVG